ncbi:hypothetical protein PEC18_37115 [Paucibacter sp. O1-1]|nr:hypothetical protein [Paucibacter sp. O1-1]MDA3831275.1 hypothetical protein [Paucibacter sp. O1-1]
MGERLAVAVKRTHAAASPSSGFEAHREEGALGRELNVTLHLRMQRSGQPPRVNPEGVLIHFLHGEQGTIVPTLQSINATAVLKDLGAATRLDIFPGPGHQIDGRLLQRLLYRLGSKVMSVMHSVDPRRVVSVDGFAMLAP